MTFLLIATYTFISMIGTAIAVLKLKSPLMEPNGDDWVMGLVLGVLWPITGPAALLILGSKAMLAWWQGRVGDEEKVGRKG